MGQYDRHVFVCTSGETCPTQGDTERFVKLLREGARKAGMQNLVRVNKAGCFSQCGHGPMVVVYPEDVWYAGVQESDLDEILTAHIVGGRPVERLRYDPGKPGANKLSDEEIERLAASRAAQAQTPAAEAVWRRVCTPAEVPANGMKQFPVNGVSVLVVHTGDAFVAFQAMCPHEAVPLEQGMHDGCLLTCLEHLWQFDLRTGAPVGDAQEGLKGYPLKEEGGALYVALPG
jgi:nitrite reductase/ring-hydroxylating ferredoxin subunit/(2Fe-2S) ferredoxin